MLTGVREVGRRQATESSWQPISSECMDEWLCLYPDRERHLSHVEYAGGCVRAVAEPHHIDYSTITVEYYTASQIVLLTSQLNYVLAGAGILDPSFGLLAGDLYPGFTARLRAGQIYYAELRTRFREKTGNSRPIEVRSSVVSVRTIRQNLFLFSRSTFCGRAVEANATLVMPLA